MTDNTEQTFKMRARQKQPYVSCLIVNPIDMTCLNDNLRESSFFSQTDLFVLARPNDDGNLSVAGHQTCKGVAATCYLSPAHAMIEAVRRTQRGEFFDVVHAGQVEQQVFRAADGTGLIAEIQLAWPACNGRIIAMQDNRSATVMQLMHHRSTTGAPLNTFEVDDAVLVQVDQLYERAGLFAWRETHRDMLAWDRARLYRMVGRAVQGVAFDGDNLANCREAALFDPEFGQWHFVPLDGQIGR
jgi:hypothetical protein